MWSLYAVLYLIGVMMLGLMLIKAEATIAGALNLVFLIIAIVLFKFALKDVSDSLDIAIDDRERAELRAIRFLLIITFTIAAVALSYGILKALFPFF